MSFNEILTATDDTLLISRLGPTEEVDGRAPTGPREEIQIISPEVVVEKEDGSEEEERQQGERISGVAPEERHGVGWTL